MGERKLSLFKRRVGLGWLCLFANDSITRLCIVDAGSDTKKGNNESREEMEAIKREEKKLLRHNPLQR